MKTNNFVSRSLPISGVTEVELCPLNSDRKYLLIYNSGTYNLEVGFDGHFIPIPPGQGLPFITAVPMNRFVGRCAIGETATAIVWES